MMKTYTNMVKSDKERLVGLVVFAFEFENRAGFSVQLSRLK